MQLNDRQIERMLRQAAAWQRFEQEEDDLGRELLARAQAVPGTSWWEQLVGRVLLSREATWAPVYASTEAAERWHEAIECKDGLGLSMVLREVSSRDVHLEVKAVGRDWAEAPLRLEIQNTPDAKPEGGAICLRWSERKRAFVAEVNLGRVPRGVGVKWVLARWADIKDEEAAWAIRHAANDPTLRAWQEAWTRHRRQSGTSRG